MKKRLTKLHLHRETLRNLQTTDLSRIAGGGTQTSCACEQATGCECDSQGAGCTLPDTACFGTCSCSILPCR